VKLFEQIEVPASNVYEESGLTIDKYIQVLIDTGEHFKNQDAFISKATRGNGDNPYVGRSFVLYGKAGGELIHVRETVQYTIDIPNPKPVKARKKADTAAAEQTA
jgi:hypothetical protein